MDHQLTVLSMEDKNGDNGERSKHTDHRTLRYNRVRFANRHHKPGAVTVASEGCPVANTPWDRRGNTGARDPCTVSGLN